jgi:hypothetical protein
MLLHEEQKPPRIFADHADKQKNLHHRGHRGPQRTQREDRSWLSADFQPQILAECADRTKALTTEGTEDTEAHQLRLSADSLCFPPCRKNATRTGHPRQGRGTPHGRGARACIRCCRHWYITLLVIEPTPWLEENQGQQTGLGRQVAAITNSCAFIDANGLGGNGCSQGLRTDF